jgi:hypothetical protein
MYYLAYLRTESVSIGNQEFVDNIGKQIEDLAKQLREEKERLEEITESEKTDEDKDFSDNVLSFSVTYIIEFL